MDKHYYNRAGLDYAYLGLLQISCRSATCSPSSRYDLYLPQRRGKDGDPRLITVSAQDITVRMPLRRMDVMFFKFVITPLIYVNCFILSEIKSNKGNLPEL